MPYLSKRISAYALCFVGALLIFWIFYRYLLHLTAPFILAFFISRLLEKPVLFLQHKLSLPRRISSLICTAFFYLSIVFIAKVLIFRAFDEVRHVLFSLPDFSVITDNVLGALEHLLNIIFKGASPEISKLIQNFIAGSLSIPIQLREKIIAATSSAASTVPDILLFIITLIVASYFFSSDYNKIKSYALKKFPAALILRLHDIKKNLSVTVLCYAKALAILAAITWAELSIGFLLLKIDNAVIYAFLIALFDALPIFGSGFILVPWAIGSLVKGAYTKAIGLASIYLAVSLIRNMLEARIIGQQTGLHPLISLFSVYIGLHLFGAYGLFLPPLIFFLKQSLRPHNRATAG